MNNRTILTGFAILVLAGVVALIVALGRDGGGGDGTGDGPAIAVNDRAPDRAGGDLAPSGDPARPQLTTDRPEGSGDERDPVVYMTDGGVLVRDHRSDPSKPAPLDNLPGPRNAPRKMNTEAIAAVRSALRKVVRVCEGARAGENSGQEARIQVVVTVSVANEQLAVGAVEVTARDISDSDAIRTCIREGFTGATMAVPGQPDIAEFQQTHPFRLQR